MRGWCLASRSRRHHFVPQTLQKRFADERRHIWYCERRSLKGSFSIPEDRNIDSCFWMRNINTTIRSDGSLSDAAETKYWKAIDDYLTEILDALGSNVRANTVSVFGDEALRSLNMVMTSLLKRSMDYFSDKPDQELGMQVLEAVKFEAGSPLNPEELGVHPLKIERPEYVGREVRLRAQGNHSGDVLRELEDYTVVYAKPQVGASFVLGSKMIFRPTKAHDGGLGATDFEMWFPIAQDAMLIRVHKTRIQPTLLTMNKSQVRRLNQLIVRESLRVGSGCKRLITSLTRSKHREGF